MKETSRSKIKKRRRSGILCLVLCTGLLIIGCNATVHAAEHHEQVSSRKEIGRDEILTGRTWEYYDYTKDRRYGCTFGGGNALDFEGTCGFELKVDESGVFCTPYRHSDRFDRVSVSIDRLDNYDLIWGQTYPIDIESWESGTIHSISMSATHELSRASFRCEGYLYKDDDGQLFTCRRAPSETVHKKRNLGLMASFAPEDFLSNEELTYPTSGTDGNCNHVKQWERIADMLICGHEDWSDEYKVYVFQEYLNRNYAFDTYRSNIIDPESRASIADVWNDDSYFMYGNRVGVCWDFVNVMTIMCRHVGIAATSIENSHHTVAAVFLNGEWVTFDITDTVRFICDLEDTDRKKWKRRNHGNYDAYGQCPTFEFLTVDQSIWTKERAWVPD